MAVNRNGSGSDGGNGGANGGSDVTSDAQTFGEKLFIDRRDFLRLVACSVSAAGAAACTDGSQEMVGSSDQALQIAGNLPIDYSFSAVRKEDLVDLRFDFINLIPDGHNRGLHRKVAGSPTFVIVKFPSQHIFEPAFRETEIDQPGALPPSAQAPINARIAGESRVAFVVPEKVCDIPLTVEGLLQLVGKLELHVAKNALPPPGVTPAAAAAAKISPPRSAGKSSRTRNLLHRQRSAYVQAHWLPPADPIPAEPEESHDPPSEPANHETSLELPFRLLLSPNRYGAFAHATNPVCAHSGRVELWHSRLGTRGGDGTIDERDPTLRKVRALWSRDPGFKADEPDEAVIGKVFEDPIELDTLSADDRSQIVHLTSNFKRFPSTDANPSSPLPRPIDVNQLMLSAMGGFLDVRGDWADNDLKDGELGALEEWQHRSALGRDNYVKVVHAGILYPFGHRASRVDVSERKFKKTEHEHVAYIRKRTFIIVREPLKTYDVGRDATETGAIPTNLRQLPFAAIKLTTTVTPSLDIVEGADDHVFVPRVGGTLDATTHTYSGGHPFRFACEALDEDGNIIRFTAPVVWLRATYSDDIGTDVPVAASDLDEVLLKYQGLSEPERTCELAGQRFAYAPSNQTDDAALETQSIEFDAFNFATETVSDATKKAYPSFFPRLARAKLAIESARQVSGQAKNVVRSYVFHSSYIDHGFSETNNAGELLLTLAPGELPVNVSFDGQSDRSGGFLSPNFDIQAVSRRVGPVSGNPTGDAVNGKFNPIEFFGSLGSGSLPKLFGVLNLTDILAVGGVDLSQAPKYITQVVTGAMGAIADLERLVDSLKSASVDVTSHFASAETLFKDLEAAFDASSPDHVAAVSRISDDIDAVIADLGSLPTFLQGVSIQPLAFKNELIDRAQRLATALDGAVTQLIQLINNLAAGFEFPTEIRTRMEWRGQVKAWDKAGETFANFFTPFDPKTGKPLDKADALLLSADILAKASGEAQLNLKCSLENFMVQLFGDAAPFLILKFDLLEFSVQSGKKPDVRLLFSKGDGIQFAGPLKFIETLKNMIPLDGFSDPPNLSVDEKGIQASFSLALPNVAVGVLSLENIVLLSSLRIPFIGDPLSFSFAFSTRENPFNLTVSLLGGGGFFGLELTPKGVKMLEASLEAGARISIDLGVASGSVSAMFGIYFRIEKLSDDKNQILLTGYFRLRGEVDVLGLISVSVTLTLELTYQAEPVNKLYGRATLEIEIDILFFSETVTVSCERRFAGSNGDPTFYQVMAPQGDFRPWDDYVAAFAA